MDYVIMAEQLLRGKRRMEAAVENLKEEIMLLEDAKYSVKTAAIGGAPITGSGSNRYEDRLIKLISLCDDLRHRRRNMVINLGCIRRGMEALSPYQQDVLTAFYVEGGKHAAERLMSKHHKERSTVYRDKEKAIKSFTQAVYGAELVP